MVLAFKGVSRKIFKGSQRKKDRKIALLSLFQGERATEKRPKNRKNTEKWHF